MFHRLTVDPPFADPALQVDGVSVQVEVSKIGHHIKTPSGDEYLGVYAVHRGQCLRYDGRHMDRVFVALAEGASFKAIYETSVEVSVFRIIKDSQFRYEERGPDRATLALLGHGKLGPFQAR